MPELTEEEARAAAASQLLLKQIASNPKARELLQQAYKTVRPDAVIPEVDQRTELNQQLTEIRDTVNSFVKTQTDAAAEAKAEAEKAQVERRMNEGFERLREQKVTPEGIEAVKKIMADESRSSVLRSPRSCSAPRTSPSRISQADGWARKISGGKWFFSTFGRPGVSPAGRRCRRWKSCTGS